MFLGPSGPACKPHMYRMRRVLPQPVSPITITGMLHLQILKLRSEREPNHFVRQWQNSANKSFGVCSSSVLVSLPFRLRVEFVLNLAYSDYNLW